MSSKSQIPVGAGGDRTLGEDRPWVDLEALAHELRSGSAVTCITIRFADVNIEVANFDHTPGTLFNISNYNSARRVFTRLVSRVTGDPADAAVDSEKLAYRLSDETGLQTTDHGWTYVELQLLSNDPEVVTETFYDVATAVGPESGILGIERKGAVSAEPDRDDDEEEREVVEPSVRWRDFSQLEEDR